MKKLTLIVFILSIGFISCSKTDDYKDSNILNSQKKAFDELMDDIESLNNDFICDIHCDTKGTGRDLTRDIADVAGGFLGTRFGGAIGASAGAAVGNPALGVVGFLAGRKYGGIVGTIAASAIAGAIYDWFGGSTSSVSLPYNDMDLMKIDENSSYGEIHNLILSRIRVNGKSYISESGDVMISELYNDVSRITIEMNIEDDLSHNSEYYQYMLDFFEDVVEITKDHVKYPSTIDYADCVYERFVKKGISEDEAQMVLELNRKLNVAASLNTDQVVEYDRAFEELVESSSLDEEDKNIIKITGSVSIRSKNYWYGEEL